MIMNENHAGRGRGALVECLIAGVPGSNPADSTSVLNSGFELKLIEIS